MCDQLGSRRVVLPLQFVQKASHRDIWTRKASPVCTYAGFIFAASQQQATSTQEVQQVIWKLGSVNQRRHFEYTDAAENKSSEISKTNQNSHTLWEVRARPLNFVDCSA